MKNILVLALNMKLTESILGISKAFDVVLHEGIIHKLKCS